MAAASLVPPGSGFCTGFYIAARTRPFVLCTAVRACTGGRPRPGGRGAASPWRWRHSPAGTGESAWSAPGAPTTGRSTAPFFRPEGGWPPCRASRNVGTIRGRGGRSLRTTQGTIGSRPAGFSGPSLAWGQAPGARPTRAPLRPTTRGSGKCFCGGRNGASARPEACAGSVAGLGGRPGLDQGAGLFSGRAPPRVSGRARVAPAGSAMGWAASRGRNQPCCRQLSLFPASVAVIHLRAACPLAAREIEPRTPLFRSARAAAAGCG